MSLVGLLARCFCLYTRQNKQIHSLQWVLLGGGFGDFPYLWSGQLPVRFSEGPITKGSGMVLGYLCMVSKAKFNAIEQNLLDAGRCDSHLFTH